MTGAAAIIDSTDRTKAESILRIAGIDGPFTLSPLPSGRNNRTAKLTTRSGDYLLKRYADNPADGRDRLGNETAFCRFAREIGIDTVPEVLAVDATSRTALFSFIAGEPMAAYGVDARAVSQAIDFAIALNRRRADGAQLPNASEAAFSLDDHNRAVCARVESLCVRVTHADAAAFLRQNVGPHLQRASCRGDRALAAGERCISPSDFGVPNTVAVAGGRICFVDFEYAGWDDPARMVCDFFLQVAVPVPARFLPRMVEMLAPHFGDADAFRRRVAALMPLYHVKWCCTLLNDFDPQVRSRREFAGFNLDAEHLARQLACAKARLADRTPIAAAHALTEAAA
jgi:hypothetical protein